MSHRIQELEQELAARDRSLKVLMDRLYERQKAQSCFSLLEQNAVLQEAVAQKTSQLEETQHQLLQASKLEAIGRLAAGVAHEINTPVQFLGDNLTFLREGFSSLTRVVGGLLELAAGHPELSARLEGLLQQTDYSYYQDEIPEALDSSFRGLERVVKIVQAMRRFSHSSRGEKRPVFLEEIVSTTLTVSACEYRPVATIETCFEPGLAPAFCIRDQLTQVVLNLLVNAAYAIRMKSDQMGVIRITTSRHGEMVRLSVSDNGAGMSRETQTKIFEPFFTTKPVGEGTGQGLSLAYRIVVENNQGSIHFESEPGVGTTFHIDLPIAPS
ncbi:ATP-binding protein [bacterium]|nr:ATP-binding protein [bacterium]